MRVFVFFFFREFKEFVIMIVFGICFLPFISISILILLHLGIASFVSLVLIGEVSCLENFMENFTRKIPWCDSGD